MLEIRGLPYKIHRHLWRMIQEPGAEKYYLRTNKYLQLVIIANTSDIDQISVNVQSKI